MGAVGSENFSNVNKALIFYLYVGTAAVTLGWYFIYSCFCCLVAIYYRVLNLADESTKINFFYSEYFIFNSKYIFDVQNTKTASFVFIP